MPDRIAYVRCGFRAGNVDICPLDTPLPEVEDSFGERVEGCVRIKTRNADFTPAYVALDWLRERDWTLSPDVPQFTQEEIGYITAVRLRERGWTSGLIEKYLLDPDKELKNPHYRTGPPMKLYALTRVAILERQNEVAAALAKTLSKRTAKTG